MKAIFLDRDGTLIEDKGYLYKCEDIEFLPNAMESLKIFNVIKYIFAS